MSPDVIKKKLVSITGYLNDLMPYRKITFKDFMHKHYEIERILELLVMTSSDIRFSPYNSKRGACAGILQGGFSAGRRNGPNQQESK